MREKVEEFAKLDAVLLAIDPHDEWASKALLKETGLTTQDLNFPLLLDPAQTVSASYGVAFQMRIHTEISNRPTTFIIDKQGIIRFAQRARTFGDRPKPQQLVEELTRLSAN